MCICVALKSVPARQTNFIICVLLFFGGHIHIDSTCACTSNHCCIKVNTEKRRIYALSNDIFSSFSNAVCALIPYPVSVYGYSVRFARCCRVCNSWTSDNNIHISTWFNRFGEWCDCSFRMRPMPSIEVERKRKCKNKTYFLNHRKLQVGEAENYRNTLAEKNRWKVQMETFYRLTDSFSKI